MLIEGEETKGLSIKKSQINGGKVSLNSDSVQKYNFSPSLALQAKN